MPSETIAVAVPPPSVADPVASMHAAATVRSGPEPKLTGHLPALDGVRGLAILMVLLLHFIGNSTATNRVEAALNQVFSYGVLGVDLFFALSGFLITGILYDARAEPAYFKNFYMRRVLRIFPLYYAVLAAVFFVVPLIPALRGSELASLREHQWWAWLYGINIYIWVQGHWSLSYLEHFWSLAVEEHFYFVWPLVVWLLGSRPRALMAASLGIAALALVGRVVATGAGVGPVPISVLTPLQLDALCIGGFFAVLARQPGGPAKVQRLVFPMIAAAVAGLALTAVLNRYTDLGAVYHRPFRVTLFRVLLAGVLLSALTRPQSTWIPRFFRTRTMIFLGKYSYGLYVYHHFFSYYFMRHQTEFAIARVVGSHALAVCIQATVGMAASVVVAWASYEFFEKHFIHLKHAFSTTKARA